MMAAIAAGRLRFPSVAPGVYRKAIKFRKEFGEQCFSCRSVCRNKPTKDEEMAAAELAPKGQKEPVESCLKDISVPYASEID
jgi:hypothetical protein